MQIFWFKKDLRIYDNEALSRASQLGPVLPIYIFEDELWKTSTLSCKHYSFLSNSLEELNRDLEKLGQNLIIETGDCLKVFYKYKKQYDFKTLWSHQETGNIWVSKRNNRLSNWLISNNIKWLEVSQNGVIRNLKSRDGWSKNWKKKMNNKIYKPPLNLKKICDKKFKIPSCLELGLDFEKNTNLVKGGRIEAVKLLSLFLAERGQNYCVNMSSPITAFNTCSTLSAHIAFGTLSIKEIYQSANLRLEHFKNSSLGQNKSWIKSISSFIKRLHWHCHFIQKLEDEPKIEYSNLHNLYDGMREEYFSEKFFLAWKSGHTGYPFLDACMRSLKVNGWINFRMRAMIMSFASYHLWLHWKPTSDFLAMLFTDFEPGIHYSQAQMQSGTTGINSIRIYNPIKQSREQDPDGIFIRKWVPELSNFSNYFIHTPWLSDVKGKDYPPPLVNEAQSRIEAAKRVFSVRNSKKFSSQAKSIYIKHGSRKKDFKRKENKKIKIYSKQQLDLF